MSILWQFVILAQPIQVDRGQPSLSHFGRIGYAAEQVTTPAPVSRLSVPSPWPDRASSAPSRLGVSHPCGGAGQNNRADHRDQQDQSRQLEQQEIFVIQDQPKAAVLCASRRDLRRAAPRGCVGFPSAKGHDELHQNDKANQQRQRHVLRHFRL